MEKKEFTSSSQTSQFLLTFLLLQLEILLNRKLETDHMSSQNLASCRNALMSSTTLTAASSTPIKRRMDCSISPKRMA